MIQYNYVPFLFEFEEDIRLSILLFLLELELERMHPFVKFSPASSPPSFPSPPCRHVSRENLFRFGKYFVTDDGKATTTVVHVPNDEPCMVGTDATATAL